jgi:uncharacterized protein YoxC
VLAFTAADIAYVALAVFLLAVGLGLGYVFLRLGGTLGRLSSFIQGTERELLPAMAKIAGSVDRVNGQLDKLDVVTDSAVDAVDHADQAVRAASFAVTRPVKKLTGWTAGVSHGASALRARRSWREAVEAARAASARRERDLEQELRLRAEEAR